jgi:hypothetical protein
MLPWPDTSCLLKTDLDGSHISCFRYTPGYVTVNGKPTDGPGHGYGWGRRETWGAKLAQAAAEAHLSCIWLANPADFSLFIPVKARGLVRLASNQREMALMWCWR